MSSPGSILLGDGPVGSVDDYVGVGGGAGLAAALARAPGEESRSADLVDDRGRGGAGFPTGMKWRTVHDDPSTPKYLVCNAAEGEPGTFKDRWLLRANPYQVLEGVAIAAHAVEAEQAFIGIKAGFEQEIGRLRGAMEAMAGRDLLGAVPIEVVAGPDEYLFGEEKALLEVIEGAIRCPGWSLRGWRACSGRPGLPTPPWSTTWRPWPTSHTSCATEPTGSPRWGPRTPPGRCCSHCAATSVRRVCTSCRWGSRSGTWCTG